MRQKKVFVMATLTAWTLFAGGVADMSKLNDIVGLIGNATTQKF